MKRCPTCQRAYSDETLRFCLEDGTALVNDSSVNLEAATLMMDSASVEPPPTEILDMSAAPTVRASQEDATRQRRAKAAPTIKQQARATVNDPVNDPVNVAAPAAKQRSTATVVIISVVATILLLGLGGLGAWLILRDKGGNTTNAATETTRTNSNSTVVAASSNTPGSNNTSAKNTNSTTIATSTPIQTPTPLATPTATSNTSATPASTTDAARKDVMNALNGWTQTMRDADLNGHMSYYASTLHTYYLQSNYSASRVRDNVARAFAKYSTFDVRLSNIQIEVDPSGDKAVATFDKTFVFTGATTYSGSGLNRFWFEKIGGRWLITGEKDLKTYYINND